MKDKTVLFIAPNKQRLQWIAHQGRVNASGVVRGGLYIASE